MFGKRGLPALLAAVAVVASLSASAGASTQRIRRVDVSTRMTAMQFLVSLGVDPSGVVIQRGAHNYAGPRCPGAGWTCTTAKRVLQIATKPGDDNQFVCTGGSSSGPGDCTIIQVASGGGRNVARCVEMSNDPNASQSCRVQQQSTTGANVLQVQQHVNGNRGAAQSATQYAGSVQTTTSGANTVQVEQQLQQQTNDTDASGSQSQDGTQQVSVTQSSDSGRNTASVEQSLALQAQAKDGTGPITQSQDTGASPNTSAAVDQSSNSGSNNANVNQSNDLQMHLHKAGSATQQQGSPGAGLAMFLNQASGGVSTIRGRQQERQEMHANQVSGALSQTQFGPMWADPSQGSNPNDRYDVDQSSGQHADGPPHGSGPANQNDQAYGQCDTSGNCTIDQRIEQQGNNQKNSCSGEACDIGLIVASDSEGSSTSTCTGGEVSEVVRGCPSPPPPPPPPFGEVNGGPGR
ncbi:MAG: hypothetical protein ACRDL2_11340 [Gaiellaceae bacterium]